MFTDSELLEFEVPMVCLITGSRPRTDVKIDFETHDCSPKSDVPSTTSSEISSLMILMSKNTIESLIFK